MPGASSLGVMMAGGQQKTSRSGARGQRGSTLSHQCLATLALATTVTRPAPVPSLRLVVLKRGNGASSGALYWGGLSRRAGSIRCSEGHARQPKTTPNSQRLRLSVVVSLLAVSPHSRPHAEEYYPGNTIALSGGNGEGGKRRGGHVFIPSPSSRGTSVPPEFAPFPATLRVGCQASSGRFPSATLDESERKLFCCWEDCI